MACRSWRGEVKAGASECLSGENAEPAFYLVQPRGIGRSEVKLDVGIALEPAVLFRLMRVQIVQHDMDLAARVLGHNLIHELQELTPPSTAVMCRLHLSSGDLKRGKQGGRAVTLIAVAESVHCLS